MLNKRSGIHMHFFFQLPQAISGFAQLFISRFGTAFFQTVDFNQQFLLERS
jgi:hypothetical protein